jgi:putative transposase
LKGTSDQYATKARDTVELCPYLCLIALKIALSAKKGLFAKQSFDSGIGGFINQILPLICWKRGKYYLKVDKNFTSQTCPNCQQRTGKKDLTQRVHRCQHCGHSESRDTASAKVIMQRGLMAVGHSVTKNACGDDATGFKQLSLFELVGNL